MGLDSPKTVNTTGKFLTAEWRDVAMLNYEVDPRLLQKLVPAGTELDPWRGKVFVSLVGFRFLKTRVLGISVPFHRNFDEVNLRFYVRRYEGRELRQGVAFIREIAPRWAVATVARVLYNENYVALPMSHKIRALGDGGMEVEYAWRMSGSWTRLSVSAAGEPALPQEGSAEHFISDHYWGYAAQRDGGCMEYQVTHPSWRVWSGATAKFDGDMEELYGPELAAVLRGKPASAFLADGSAVTVHRGRRLPAARHQKV
jgi:uncharacterized protein